MVTYLCAMDAVVAAQRRVSRRCRSMWFHSINHAKDVEVIFNYVERMLQGEVDLGVPAAVIARQAGVATQTVANNARDPRAITMILSRWPRSEMSKNR